MRVLKYGANINAEDKSGKTASMYVIESKHSKVEDLKFLLNKKANFNIKDNGRKTILMYAINSDPYTSFDKIQTIKEILH